MPSHFLRVWGLRQPPGFLLAALGSFALGIGANSTIFSVVDGVLWKPLPYRQAGSLTFVWETHAKKGREANASYADLRDWSRLSTSFAALGGYQFLSFDLTGIEPAERVWAARTTCNLLPLLGVAPSLGRLPAPEDCRGEPVAVASDGLFRRLGGDPRLLGKPIRLNGLDFTLVGVMPPGFRFPPPIWVSGQSYAVPVDLWLPIRPGKAEEDRGARLFFVVGRLAPQVTLERAQHEMTTIAERLGREYPDDDGGWGVRLVPLGEQVVGHARTGLLVLLAAVGLVLLLACGNVSCLLISRSTARHREFAIRAALGAGRRRLAAALIGEVLSLALLGSLAGLLLARGGLALLTAFGPAEIPRLDEIGLDGRVLAFTLGLALLAALAAGLTPALAASRPAMARYLHGGHGHERLGGRWSPRSLLVAAELALALVLVIAVGLLGRSFARLLAVDPGFSADRVLALDLSLPESRYPSSVQVLACVRELARRVSGLPGVEEVGVINFPPLGGYRLRTDLEIEGRPKAQAAERPLAEYRVVNPELFRALRVPLVAGRGLGAGDDEMGARVVLISRSLARRYWPEGTPLGARVAIRPLAGVARGRPMAEPVSFQVVGVTGDVVQASLEAEPPPVVWVAYPQDPWPFFSLLVRIHGEPEAAISSLRRQIAGFDKNLAIANVHPLAGNLVAATARTRFVLWLIAGFSLLAVTLAALGVFGLVSSLVHQRLHELGVRVALGARAPDLLALVFRLAAPPLALGLLAGTLGAFGATRFLASLLYRVDAADPASFLLGLALLAGTAAAAAVPPVLRALRQAPMSVLENP